MVLVPVVVGLEGPHLVEAEVLGLVVRELRQVRVERGQVQARHVLVHLLREKVHVGLGGTDII